MPYRGQSIGRMHRRTVIQTTAASITLAASGCLSDSGSETEDRNSTGPDTAEDSDTTGPTSGENNNNGTEDRKTGTVTIKLSVTERVSDSFTQLELGLGKITLHASGDQSSRHTVLETVDVSSDTVPVIESEEINAGNYQSVTLTATISNRELENGSSPYISKDITSTEIGDAGVQITDGSDSALTIVFDVFKNEEEEYILTVQQATTKNEPE